MRLALWCCWWWIRYLFNRVMARWLKGDRRIAFLALASQASEKREFDLFVSAAAFAGEIAQLTADWMAYMALSYYEAGYKKKADHLFAIASMKDAENPLVLKYYGTYLDSEDQSKEAVAYLEKALAKMPKDPEILSWLGNAYFGAGNCSKARAYYEECLRIEGGESGGPYSGLAHIAATAGNWDEAIRCWRKALVYLPPDGQEWYNLGNALCTTEQYREAIAAFQKSLKLGWNEPHRALYGMALSHWQLGHVRRARKYCHRALRLEPTYDLAMGLQSTINESENGAGGGSLGTDSVT